MKIIYIRYEYTIYNSVYTILKMEQHEKLQLKC